MVGFRSVPGKEEMLGNLTGETSFGKLGTWQSKATAKSICTKAEKQRRSEERGGKEIVLKADSIQYCSHATVRLVASGI